MPEGFSINVKHGSEFELERMAQRLSGAMSALPVGEVLTVILHHPERTTTFRATRDFNGNFHIEEE